MALGTTSEGRCHEENGDEKNFISFFPKSENEKDF